MILIVITTKVCTPQLQVTWSDFGDPIEPFGLRIHKDLVFFGIPIFYLKRTCIMNHIPETLILIFCTYVS